MSHPDPNREPEVQCTCTCDVCMNGSHCGILDTGCAGEPEETEDDLTFMDDDALYKGLE